jgi:hypothetical protein
MGEWISVETRLPEPRERVLIANHSGHVFIGCIQDLEEWGAYSDADWIYWDGDTNPLAYWQPLPAPPEVNDND